MTKSPNPAVGGRFIKDPKSGEIRKASKAEMQKPAGEIIPPPKGKKEPPATDTK